jgi:hypothetical protein
LGRAEQHVEGAVVEAGGTSSEAQMAAVAVMEAPLRTQQHQRRYGSNLNMPAQ